ncbi:unnamed protein product, partial [Choristocarpus tenellus]
SKAEVSRSCGRHCKYRQACEQVQCQPPVDVPDMALEEGMGKGILFEKGYYIKTSTKRFEHPKHQHHNTYPRAHSQAAKLTIPISPSILFTHKCWTHLLMASFCLVHTLRREVPILTARTRCQR